jgi:hypothetical protein
LSQLRSRVPSEAVAAARDLFALVSRDRSQVLAAPGATASSARLFEVLPEHPVVSIGRAMELLGTSRPTATKAVNSLVIAKVLNETTGRRRDRVFAYSDYVEILRVGTDLETT